MHSSGVWILIDSLDGAPSLTDRLGWYYSSYKGLSLLSNGALAEQCWHGL